MDNILAYIVLPRLGIETLRRILSLSTRLQGMMNEMAWKHHVHYRIPLRYDDSIIDQSAAFGLGTPNRWRRYALAYSPRGARRMYKLNKSPTESEPGVYEEVVFDTTGGRGISRPSSKSGTRNKAEKTRSLKPIIATDGRGLYLYADNTCDKRGNHCGLPDTIFRSADLMGPVVGMFTSWRGTVLVTPNNELIYDSDNPWGVQMTKVPVPGNLRIIDYISNYTANRLSAGELLLLSSGQLMCRVDDNSPFRVVESFKRSIHNDTTMDEFKSYVNSPEPELQELPEKRFLKGVHIRKNLYAFVDLRGTLTFYNLFPTPDGNISLLENEHFNIYLRYSDIGPIVLLKYDSDKSLFGNPEFSMMAVDSSGKCFCLGHNTFGAKGGAVYSIQIFGVNVQPL